MNRRLEDGGVILSVGVCMVAALLEKTRLESLKLSSTYHA